MKRQLGTFLIALMLGSSAVAATNWTAVDRTMGRPAAAQPGGVHRYSFPRSDLKVSLGGVQVEPALALGSWLAFRGIGDKAEVMGDLVLTQDEVNPVLSRLLAGGMTITALHNHLLGSTPTIMYMHVHGVGDALKLAATLRGALAASNTPTAAPGAASTRSEPQIGPEADRIDQVMRAKGKVAGGTYQFSFPRAEQITDDGMAMPPSLGVATGITFQPTGGGRAVATGDFVLIGSEVAPVLGELRRHGIEVTALHNHLLDEQPRLFFMHFWGNGDAAALARGLRAALDRMNLARPAG